MIIRRYFLWLHEYMAMYRTHLTFRHTSLVRELSGDVQLNVFIDFLSLGL